MLYKLNILFEKKWPSNEGCTSESAANDLNRQQQEQYAEIVNVHSQQRFFWVDFESFSPIYFD